MKRKREKKVKGKCFKLDSLPEDVALRIVSCLEVTDVFSLARCSKYWRKICESDYLWKSLCEERWPSVVLKEKEAKTSDDYDQENASNLKGWRGLYVRKHDEMVGNVAYLKRGLSCQSIYVIDEDSDYLKAIEDMKSMQFGFNDVRILLFQPKIHVLLNLLGLHYCIRQLGVQVGSVLEAISSCNIQDRDIDIRWWYKGTWLDPIWFYHLRVSLKDLTTKIGEQILRKLEKETTDEFAIQISAAENDGAVVSKKKKISKTMERWLYK